MKELAFRNGDQLPAIGLGTWKSQPGEVFGAVIEAIQAGYRHIDCAHIYGNEAEVGRALEKITAEHIRKREELWITSKLWNNAHGRDEVLPALKKTLADLQLDYLDLYLMHWPVALRPGVGFPKGPEDFRSLTEAPLIDTWRAMEEALKLGLARHIGVSNFSVSNLDHLLRQAVVAPEMNQVELHPCLPQDELLAFCRNHGIHVTAYSPLGSRDRSADRKKPDEPDLFQLPAIVDIAKKHGCTPAQVLIAWHVLRGTAVVPKSVNPKRIRENLAAADVPLDETDLRTIAAVDRPYRYIDGTLWTRKGSPYTLAELWG